MTVKEVLANAEKRIDNAFGDQPLVEATVRHVMGVSYHALGQYKAAERDPSTSKCVPATGPLPASRLFPPRVQLLLNILIGNCAAGIGILQATLDHPSERQFAENFVVAAVLRLASDNRIHRLFGGRHVFSPT